MKYIILIALFFLAVQLSGCFAMPVEEAVLPPPLTTAPEPRALRTAVVERGDVFLFTTSTAAYLPTRTESLHFPVANRLIRGVYASVGDRVYEGDILAELDDPDIYDQLMAVRQTENWILLQLSQISEQHNFALSQAQVTGVPVDDARYLADRSRLRNELEVVRMRVAYLEEAADNLIIRAPFDGVVIWVMNFGGVMRSTLGQNVITIADQGLYIFRYTGRYAQHFEVGQTHDVTIGGQIFPSVVIDPDAEGVVRPMQTGAPAADAFFRITGAEMPVVTPFSTASIQLIHDAAYDVLVLPARHINNVAGRVFVNLLENGIVVMRDIEIGLEGNALTEIVSGLEEGDVVVIP